jgi:hypothetical protein
MVRLASDTPPCYNPILPNNTVCPGALFEYLQCEYGAQLVNFCLRFAIKLCMKKNPSSSAYKH